MSEIKQLVFHGGIIFLIGLLCGVPFGQAIARGKSDAVIRAWRVAHAGVTAGGVWLLVLATVVPQLRLGTTATLILVWASIASGYGFALALPLGAYLGYRGLKLGPPLANGLVYVANVIGVVGSLVGACLLLVGAYSAL